MYGINRHHLGINPEPRGESLSIIDTVPRAITTGHHDPVDVFRPAGFRRDVRGQSAVDPTGQSEHTPGKTGLAHVIFESQNQGIEQLSRHGFRLDRERFRQPIEIDNLQIGRKPLELTHAMSRGVEN